MESYKYLSSESGEAKELYALRSTRQERADHNMFNRKSGKVLVRLDPDENGRVEQIWEAESRSVYDKKRDCWRRKIDYVCEHMGGRAVEAEIRGLVGEKATVSDLFSRSDWQSAYLLKLDEMVKQVNEVLA